MVLGGGDPLSQSLPLPSIPVGARLLHFWEKWQALGLSPWVVSVLRSGYNLEFTRDPPLTRTPSLDCVSANQSRNQVLQLQIEDLLAKGALEEVQDPSTPGFYSRLFVVPKKSGGWRPIIDLSILNTYLKVRKFRMETPASIRAALRSGRWVFSLDLKDAYFHIPIHPTSRKFLRVCLMGKVFQFRALPFGLSSAPWLFTKVMAEIKALVHAEQTSLFQYLDDWLGDEDQESSCRKKALLLRSLCLHLGLVVNEEKSDLVPSQRFVFVGILFDLVVGKVFPTPENLDKIASALLKLRSAASLSAQSWQSILGTLGSQDHLIPLGRLHLRPFQLHLNSHWNAFRDPPEMLVPVPPHLAEWISWWEDRSHLTEGVPLSPPQPTVRVFTDASTQGWGAHFGDQTCQGTWSAAERKLHINVLELRAVRLALAEFAPPLGSVVLVATDNTTVVAYINHQGGTRSPSLWEETWLLFSEAHSRDLVLRARHIPGHLNVIADQLSRAGQILPTEWSLHQDVAQDLFARWGQPNLDLFATRYNRKCLVFVSPVPDPLALETDALSMDWEGLSAYAYPPHQILLRVLRKLQETRSFRLILVAPLWVNQPWFPLLQEMSTEPPLALPPWPKLLHQPRSDVFHHDPSFYRLHAWLLVGKH